MNPEQAQGQEQEKKIPVIGNEMAIHYLMQIEAKVVSDAQKMAVVFKLINELVALKDDKVNEILDKNGIQVNGTA